MLKSAVFMVLVSFLVGPAKASAANSSVLPTVDYVDLNQYVGKWYEIASVPAWFQKKCVKNTTAEYRALDFDRIDVINTCEKSDGTLNVANGIAHVVNTTTQAELKVSFVPLFSFFGWFAGQYKVLALGDSYEYSVVGDDTRGFGWILSRTPTLPVATLVMLEKKITAAGYDSCQFLTSLQDGGAYSARIPLCELVK